MEIKKINFQNCKNLTEMVKRIFDVYQEINSINIRKILRENNIDSGTINSISSTVSQLAKSKKIQIIRSEKCLTDSKIYRLAPVYKWVDNEPVSIDIIKDIQDEIFSKEEQVIDNVLSLMRQQLIQEFAPLLKVQKELQSVKKELIEVLDENRKLKDKIQKRDIFLGNVSKKIQNQYDQIIEGFANYFNVTKQSIEIILTLPAKAGE
jgi:hypothetical protein